MAARRKTLTSKVELAGFPVLLKQKRVKNLILRVDGEDGQLSLSIPLGFSLKSAEAFVESRRPWIRAQLDARTLRLDGRGKVFEDSSIVYLAGKPRLLRSEREGSLERQLNKLYRELTREAVGSLLPKLEERFQLEVDSWRVQKMESRWGSCTSGTKRICINSKLAKRAPILLEYVLIHELMHLREANHGRGFYRLMDEAMPDWQIHRQALKEPLLYEGWPLQELKEKAWQDPRAERILEEIVELKL